MKQGYAPVKDWRVEIRKRHPAEVTVRPAKRVRKDRLIVDLGNRRMPRAVPRAREFTTPNRSPQL